jgi:Domain of unknown function (DUF4145)
MDKVTPPKVMASAFTCPHCAAYAQQIWYQVQGNPTKPMFGQRVFEDVDVGMCTNCAQLTIWSDGRLIDPDASPAPMPNDDLPDDIKKDYEEARSIVAKSPRGAAALLRLCIQKLCIELGGSGKDLNKDIGDLVKKGLPPRVQQMLDAVRVIGNNAVHPGEIDLNDTPETAASLFNLVNAITDQMITHPKQVEALYEALPAGAREAIERRDESSS